MKKYTKFLMAGMMAAMAAMVTLTGCTTEEQKEAAAKYQEEAETYLEGNNYQNAQESMKKALEQTPKDKELIAAAEEVDKKAEEMSGYTNTMQAALEAIESDNAQALYDLQLSEEGQALAKLVGDEGSYIYIPEGSTSGKGIGFYSFAGCDCDQWYYGDYVEGKREGNGIWYFLGISASDGSLYKEVYNGQWSGDLPNGTGHQTIVIGETVRTNQDFQVTNGLFNGTYPINDTLEDGTTVSGSYTIQDGKYVTISDEELSANSFAVPDEPHQAIAFLYDASGAIRSCTIVYGENIMEGVVHFNNICRETNKNK